MELTEREERKRAAHRNLYAPLQAEPIDLDEIFAVMIDSIRYDYVGYERSRRRFTPTEYRTYILSHHRYNTLTLQMLARALHQFAADMHDRHLVFHCDDWIDYRNTDLPFRVRAQRDCLWVTEAEEESPLAPGDRIVSVQGMTPEQIRRYMRGNSFYSEEPERELWGGYLRMANAVEIEKADGSRETVKLPALPAKERDYPITLSRPAPDTLCLRLERLDREAMEELLAEHEGEIAGCRKLILDLRRCVGGDEDACWPLLPYLLDKPRTLGELLNDKGSYVNCTRTNCELRYRQLSAYEETLSDPEERSLLAEERRFYLDNYGKGLCFKAPEAGENPPVEPAEQAPKQVIMLTDTFCENEGEQFAAMVQRCGGKIRTIGRPTMGTLDTFDPITVALNEHMTLSYPIAMSVDAYEGRGVADKGLPVEEYIPWTPAEIGEDRLLQRALEL